MQEGIDAVIVDNVLAIRKGLTNHEELKKQKKAEKAAAAAALGVAENGRENGVTNGVNGNSTRSGTPGSATPTTVV